MKRTTNLRRFFAVLSFLILGGVDAFAQDAGLYVTVPNPLTSEGFTRIRNRIEQVRAKPETRPGVVIFDFNPLGKDSNTTDFGSCYDLADYIAKLTDVPTVGYIHQKVSGHSVLPALACKQLVFGDKGSIGEVVPASEPPLAGYRAKGYEEILGTSSPAFVAVAKKMYDRDVMLRKAKRGKTDWFVDLRDRKKWEADGISLSDNAPMPLAPDGRVGMFNATAMRDLGLSKRTVGSKRDLLDAYGLGASVLREDISSEKATVAYRYTISGPVDLGMKESLARIILDATRNKATHFFLEIKVFGGDPLAARELAEKLIEFQQSETPIRIIGYIPDEAPDTATIIALGCSEIVMSQRKDAGGSEGSMEATLGNFETLPGKEILANPAQWVPSLRELAEKQGYPSLPVEGMLQPDMSILRVVKRSDRRLKRFMNEAEYEAQKAQGEWVLEKSVKAKGIPFKLTATQAEEYGFARFVIEKREPADLYAKYGIDPKKVRDATPAWLDRFANFLRNPAVTVLLVVIGFTGLILELKVPGATVPGIVAALCFILVFWAHTQFSGQVAVLAGLLFIFGLVLILLEVFVLPGFGVAGILGILLILGSLGLATLGTADGGLPTTTDDWIRLATKMSTYLFGMIGGVVSALVIARFLPKVPYANRMMLAPPSEKPELNVPVPGAEEAAAMLGAVGVTVTVLRPAGSVQFGEAYMDVVSDGSFIPVGSRVQVIEVESNRIVVREVS
ncbi:MAG: NfeD family protein [Fimbriiglobus sp.]